MQTETVLDLERIRDGFPGITPAKETSLLEFCVASLHRNNHRSGILMQVETCDKTENFELHWTTMFDDQSDRATSNQEEATEHGAECIAILLAARLTDYKVIRRARKRTGIDYYLGKEKTDEKQNQLLVDCARLEISGIFQGKPSDIRKRYDTKIQQTKHSQLPVFIAIVEFGVPCVLFKQRS